MKNLVGLWVNLSRAYEVALLGNLSIQVVFQKDYQNGFDDYKQIKSFYKGVNFVEDGDLIVEIHKPDYNDRINYETLQDIQKRVEAAKSRELPQEFSSTSCDELLKTGTNRLNYSYTRREKVIEVSKVIAKLEGKPKIEPQHLAEAIQYSFFDETCCNAENETINFGQGIQIALSEIDFEDIDKAISYLQGLKQKQ